MQKPVHQHVVKTFVFSIAIIHFIKSLRVSVLGSPAPPPMNDAWSLAHQGSFIVAGIPEQLPGIGPNRLAHIEPGHLYIPEQVVPTFMAYYESTGPVAMFAPDKPAEKKTLSAAAPAYEPLPKELSADPLGAHPSTPEISDDLGIEPGQSEPPVKQPGILGASKNRNGPNEKKVSWALDEDQSSEEPSSSGELPSQSKKAAKPSRFASLELVEHDKGQCLPSGKPEELEKPASGMIQTSADQKSEGSQEIEELKNSNKELGSLNASQNEPSNDENQTAETKAFSNGAKSKGESSKPKKAQGPNRKQKVSTQDEQAWSNFGMIDGLLKGTNKDKTKTEQGKLASGNEKSNSGKKSNGNKNKVKNTVENGPKAELVENKLDTTPEDVVDGLLSAKEPLFSSNPQLEEDVGKIFQEIFTHPKGFGVPEIDEIWKKYQASSPTPADEPSQVESYKNMWKESNLDPNLMMHVSNLLKVDEKGEHIGIKKMDSPTFQMIVSAAIGDQELMTKIYKCLEISLGSNEAFRRMTALSRQLVQMNLPELKIQLERWAADKDLDSMFVDSQSGLFQKSFDMYGHYGISKNINVMNNDVYKHKSMLDIYNKIKYYNNALGGNEVLSRSPPAVHFDRNIFQNFINTSQYRNIIHSDKFISSMESNGLSMNRILTVILVLGLEDRNWLGSFQDFAMVHYMSKVLFRMVSASDCNHLAWDKTAERHWLVENYGPRYSAAFKTLLGKLETNRQNIQVPRAFYSDVDGSMEKELTFYEEKRPGFADLRYKALYHLETHDPILLEAETWTSKQLAAKFKLLEPLLRKKK
ncbi:hypothetical protein PTTG_28509 [Puccinia triticina 1-1 BBBD Race 1]|uniref:Uncharacterized protein n=2 Tax=Puccinia triticina TaxID=208348 RepID=A0A180GAZ5_PUCT1|nr:uncharacterized protein PtA15_2A712 [Puccinia triticina]OAV89845.1 hypothetical protein PTTG_28509 [Puccinia triticina 1-1 BBBD Race 1]WAQ82395.1 hypothetical protein PtA15_2A712 [Puccinia triticina]